MKTPKGPHLFEAARGPPQRSGSIPCKSHAGIRPVAHQVYVKVEVHVHLRRKDQNNCVSRFAFYYVSTQKNIVSAINMPTRKLTPHQRSSGQSVWNAPWLKVHQKIKSFVLFYAIKWSSNLTEFPRAQESMLQQ